MRSKRYTIFFILACSGFLLGLNSVNAQPLVIPIGSQSERVIVKPNMGMDMNAVLAEFGEPLQRHDSVGEPPITRWQYERFSVYFESDVVMHSVVHFVPTAIEQVIDANTEVEVEVEVEGDVIELLTDDEVN